MRAAPAAVGHGGSEATPRWDRAGGEDARQHFPTMGNGLTAWRGTNRRRVWLTAGLVVVLLLGAGAVRALTAGADEQPAPAPTVRVDRGAVTTEVATTGTVEPAQTRRLSTAPWTA